MNDKKQASKKPKPVKPKQEFLLNGLPVNVKQWHITSDKKIHMFYGDSEPLMQGVFNVLIATISPEGIKIEAGD